MRVVSSLSLHLLLLRLLHLALFKSTCLISKVPFLHLKQHFPVYTSQMMAKCLECTLIQCQLQLQSLLFLQLHQSTHQAKVQATAAAATAAAGENASRVEENVAHDTAHTCHLGECSNREAGAGSNESSFSSIKEWPLLLSNLMMQTNNQHLVHHLLASLTSPRVNVINGDNSPAPNCKKHATGSTGKRVPTSSSTFTPPAGSTAADDDADDDVRSCNLSHSPSINYLHREGSIKSSSVRKLFPSPRRPDKDETKSHTSSAHSSSSSLLLNNEIVSTAKKPSTHPSPVNRKMYHDDASHLSAALDYSVNQSVSFNDLPDSINHVTSSSSTSTSSSPSSSCLLTSRQRAKAKSIGADLRNLARSFHLSFHNNHTCIP